MSRDPNAGGQLGPSEIARYRRHLTLPEIGVEGQLRLRGSRVLIVGAGGLGSPAALYLAAAGIGRLGLVDDDAVDSSNLQRQVLYGTADVGRPKVEAARERLTDLNPEIEIETLCDILNGEEDQKAVLYDNIRDVFKGELAR